METTGSTTSKERPILFNAEMVNAILSGRKTQTRRIIANTGADNCIPLQKRTKTKDGIYTHVTDAPAYGLCPLGKVGDQLWVREAYRMAKSLDAHSPSVVAELSLNAGYKKPWAPIQLEADGTRIGKWAGFDTPPVLTEAGKLRPSLHMPRWASRINLLITGVRVERLQDISQEDAQAEGMELTGWRPTYSDPDSGGEVETPYDNFAELWISIYGEENWQANPWVWCITFERMEAK
ncbi:ASCH domain-containing protein [Yersinia proxima]|uniref:hypothetical protein n=1 Tax=Yersinia proxima TaxID=2890316 RepID=UPI001D12CCC8|nr:hypothetical protein [Yersinia proxima]